MFAWTLGDGPVSPTHPHRALPFMTIITSPDPRLRPVRALLRAAVAVATLAVAAYAGLLV